MEFLKWYATIAMGVTELIILLGLVQAIIDKSKKDIILASISFILYAPVLVMAILMLV